MDSRRETAGLLHGPEFHPAAPRQSYYVRLHLINRTNVRSFTWSIMHSKNMNLQMIDEESYVANPFHTGVHFGNETVHPIDITSELF